MITEKFIRLTASDALGEYKKMTVRLVQGKTTFYQAEKFKNNQVFHTNFEDFDAFFHDKIEGKFKQISIFYEGKTVMMSRNGNGEYRTKETKNDLKAEVQSHNREKHYILEEGEEVPALVDLGVFTKDYKIVKAKYDKYKQINRFLELVDDQFKEMNEDELTILDFGCGKSYLTFILYYYFAIKKGVKVKVIGYDLKRDVVEHCNKIAKNYGYTSLEFVVADVTKDVLYDKKIDMIVTLHACDTATDYALSYAVKKGAKYIFSVPCCQHEVNLSIHGGGDLDILLRYGIVKERVSALLTDSIRAMLLEDNGYKVDMIEFVDFEHSPKNIMIRARKEKIPSRRNEKEIQKLVETYGFKQSLYELLKNRK